MKIRVVWEGRTRDEHFRALQSDYAERISHFVPLTVEEVRSGGSKSAGRGKLTRREEWPAGKTGEGFTVLLDPRGEQWTSETFAAWLERKALQGTKEIAFLVGGADGFSEADCRRAGLLLSLSKMTLTHDWARTLLLEQIYRAFTILRGYPYPR
jgi:23S rRNA (pseudouridine1915-N3)-methyltransferase